MNLSSHQEMCRILADRFFLAYQDAVAQAASDLGNVPCKIEVPLDLILRFMPVADAMGMELKELIPAVLQAFLDGDIEPIGSNGGAA